MRVLSGNPQRFDDATPRVVRAGWHSSAMCLAVCCLLACGCRTFSSREPVSKSVASGRQLTQQGANAMQRGDWKRAESVLARAVQVSPNEADAHRQYAETLWHRGDLQQALIQLQQARKLAGDDPSLAVRMGELHLAQGHVQEAGTSADEALRTDPKFAPGWALRGRVAAANGNKHQALTCYQRALGYNPDAREVDLLVAETYRDLNMPDRTLVTLQSLLDEYPRGEEPQQLLLMQGQALTAMGRYDDASRSLSHAARREHPTSDVYCALAEAEMLAGRTAPAQQALSQALALDANHANSRALAARMHTLVARETSVRR